MFNKYSFLTSKIRDLIIRNGKDSKNNMADLLETRENPVYVKTLNTLCNVFGQNKKISIQDYKKIKS